MRRFCLFGFILLFGIFNISAQSGRIKQEVKTTTAPQIEGPVSNAPPPRQPPIIIPQNISTERREIPDHTIYEMVLRLARHGWAPKKERGFSVLDIFVCRKYTKQKVLSSKHNKALQAIAEEAFLEIDKLERRMKVLLAEYRASIPTQRPLPGETRPRASPELSELSAKKRSIVLESIEKIKTALGEKEFAKFTAFVDENIRSAFKKGSVVVP